MGSTSPRRSTQSSGLQRAVVGGAAGTVARRGDEPAALSALASRSGLFRTKRRALVQGRLAGAPGRRSTRRLDLSCLLDSSPKLRHSLAAFGMTKTHEGGIDFVQQFKRLVAQTADGHHFC